MFRQDHPLFFPQLLLVEAKCVVRNKTTGKEKFLELYKLDWTKSDEIQKDRLVKWNQFYFPDVEINWINILSDHWQNVLDNFVFSISRDYLKIIRRYTIRAVEEANISLPFDTIIRDKCFDITKQYVKGAFFLLSDCLYNEKNKYFDREYNHIILPLLLCKFWHGNTARGIILDYAGIYELKEYREKHAKSTHLSVEQQKMIDSFISTTCVQQQSICQEYDKMSNSKYYNVVHFVDNNNDNDELKI